VSDTDKEKNIVWREFTVNREMREDLSGHRGAILWFTGLPCSGKTTMAQAVEEVLWRMGYRTFVLDGDNVRHGLCSDLGFSPEDREENIRRVSEVAKLFLDSGAIAITAFISPFREDRDKARALVSEGDFFEIFCDSPLDVCEERDVKGHYKRARAGEIDEFTGVSSPYEPPENPEIRLDTANLSIDECGAVILESLSVKGILNAATTANLLSSRRMAIRR